MYSYTKKQLLIEAIDLVALLQGVVGDRPYHDLSKEVAAGIAALSRNLRDTLEALHEVEQGISSEKVAMPSRGASSAVEVSSYARVPETTAATALVQVTEQLPPVVATSSTKVPLVTTSTTSHPATGAPIIRRQTMQIGQTKFRDLGGRT